MITVVMPYWERYQAALTTMKSFDELYGDDVKVIIVDDGSPTQPAKPLEDLFDRLIVLSLPVKYETKNPCIPMNRGAKLVDSEYIGLSNPETYHKEPSLYEMVDLIKDDNDYILAPAWCPELNTWHCHPTLQPDGIPAGTGFHHMGLMKKTLWDKIGGMDEEYRDGYCFDDTDFVMRLVAGNANFIYSTKPVFHSRNNAKAPPPSGGWYKNRDLYISKWNVNGTINL